VAFKVAFIGTHGVGKTTLVYGLAAALKARDFSLEVIVEIARRCPLPLNEETSLAAQSWILHNQVAEEVVAEARYPVVICDRSVLDNYVYLLLAAGSQPALDGLVSMQLATYDLLVQVPIVEGAEVLADGVRSTNNRFRRAVEQRLNDELARRQVPVLRLDPACREGWLAAVEEIAVERLASPQMRLL
jgi:nicotinamide riboside kinase